MTPLIHSTAGMPEKNGILSLRAAVTAFSSRADDEGEKLAVAAAYVLSPSLDSVSPAEKKGREGERDSCYLSNANCIARVTNRSYQVVEGVFQCLYCAQLFFRVILSLQSYQLWHKTHCEIKCV